MLLEKDTCVLLKDGLKSSESPIKGEIPFGLTDE